MWGVGGPAPAVMGQEWGGDHTLHLGTHHALAQDRWIACALRVFGNQQICSAEAGARFVSKLRN